jgi:hypothetical protein
LLASPSFWAGVLWALAAIAAGRRSLRRDGLAATVFGPPVANAAAGNGVLVVVDRLEPTCLERALVLQRWLAARGHDHEIVIGVRRGEDLGFEAHAWLAGEVLGTDGFEELRRLASPPVRPR